MSEFVAAVIVGLLAGVAFATVILMRIAEKLEKQQGSIVHLLVLIESRMERVNDKLHEIGHNDRQT